MRLRLSAAFFPVRPTGIIKVAERTHSLALMPQLDSIRAISVFAVIYTHYIPIKYWAFNIYWGEFGVRCFFVLSGFLITTILLRDRDKATSLRAAYMSFLVRRALRLYPALIAVLLVCALLGVKPVRQTLLWNLAYLTNFYIAMIDALPGATTHLWTLAVEEQFYLIWPVVIFFAPRRLLPFVLFCVVVSALVFRLLWRSAGLGELGANGLPPGSFDALAMGALLALFKDRQKLIATAGLTSACFWLSMTLTGWPGDFWFFKETDFSGLAANLVFVWIVARAAVGIGGFIGAVLDNAALQYIGIISYGIYLIHNFTPAALDTVGLLQHGPWWHETLAAVGLTVALASLSWHLLERPIIHHGRRRLITAIAS